MTYSISLQMPNKINVYLTNKSNLKRIPHRLKTTRRVSVKSLKIKSIFKIWLRILHKLTMVGCLTLMIFSSGKSLRTQSYRALELKRDSLWSMVIRVTRLVIAIRAMNKMSSIKCCLVAMQWALLDQLLLIIKSLNLKIKPFRLNLNLSRCLAPTILW